MNKRSFGSNHLRFLLAAIIMLVLADRFIFDGTRPYIDEAKQEAAARQQAERLAAQEVFAGVESAPKLAEVKSEKVLQLAKLEPEIRMKRRVEFGPKDLPAWRKHAVKLPPTGKPKVIIVIDDLGVSRKNSQAIIDLDGPLTLAFLPYAKRIRGMVEESRAKGHEIIVHMPMEPMNGDLDTGDIVLRTDQGPDEFRAMLDKGLAAFDGFVGINNHMGSRMTQEKGAMRLLMNELKLRGLLFLDSKTISSSVAGETAAETGVPYAIRDVFIDHDPSLEGVRAALEQVEQVAREHGQAIAIGHPKKNTIAALQEWLPTLESKGFALVPISSVVKLRTPSSTKSVAAVPLEGPVQPQ